MKTVLLFILWLHSLFLTSILPLIEDLEVHDPS